MKVYEVEYRAVITLAAQDMQKAASQGAAAINIIRICSICGLFTRGIFDRTQAKPMRNVSRTL